MTEQVHPATVQFVDAYFPHIDGVVRTVHNYATVLNRRSSCGVVAPQGEEPYEDNFPYSVLRTVKFTIPFIGYGFPLPECTARLKQRVMEHNVELFHAHSPFLLGQYALKLGKKYHIPVVATFHSKYYDDFKSITRSDALARVATKTIVQFYEKADAVWTVSHSAAETLREYGYTGDITIMPNGTDIVFPDNADELKAQAREAFALPTDKHILLYVGQQIWQKNIRLMLDTLRLLCDESDDYRLVMVGTGMHEKQIRKYVDELGLEDAVLFTGNITDGELLQGMYLNADLFFFPSQYDTFSLVVREAAALGLPSLLVEGSAAAEDVSDGENGYVTAEDAGAMAERVRRIFADPDTMMRVGENARASLPVNWESRMDEVEEQYRRVIAEYQAKGKSRRRRRTA